MKQAILLEDKELTDLRRGRWVTVELGGQPVVIGAIQSKAYRALTKEHGESQEGSRQEAQR